MLKKRVLEVDFERKTEREKILDLLSHVTRGQLEERRVLIDQNDPLAEISWGLNHLLDKVESFLRESSIAMKELATGQKPRGIDPRGYQGTFVETLTFFNRELEESYRRKQQIHNMLDNLGEAYMVIDRQGRIDDSFSKATEDYFAENPKGKTLMDLLRLDDSARASVLDWLNMTFDEMIPFDSIVELGPKSFEKVEGKFIELKYRAIRNEANAISGLIVIGSDKTYERQLKAKADSEAAFVKTIVMVMSDRETFVDFVHETRSFFSWMEEQLKLSPSQFDATNCFRLMHSLKGGSAAFGLLDVKNVAHAAENRLGALKEAASPDAAAELFPQLSEDLNQLRTMFEGFLQTNEAVLGKFDANDSGVRAMPVGDILSMAKELEVALGDSSPVLNVFRDRFLLENVDQFFTHFERVVASVAEKLDKLVEFKIEPSNVRVYKKPYKPLLGAMIHAIRNAVDHGIETPDVRMEAGKSEFGQIALTTRYCEADPNRFQICITDDGAGMNAQRIGELAVKRGLVTADKLAKLTPDDINQFVLEPGFSTKENVSDLSGRGVGLDAIRYEANRLGGRVWVESTQGKGSRLIIELPVLTGE